MKMKKVTNFCLITAVALLFLAVVFLALAFNEAVSELKDETIRSAEYEQKALDWQIKAEDLQIKLARAETDLQSCSEKIEEQETTVVTQADEITALKDEITLLEGIIEGYNTVPESDYTNEDKTILAATMYAENYINGRYEMALTGSVVINRKNSPLYPNTIKDVVFQIDGKYEQYAKRTKNIVERVLRGEETIPSECHDLAENLLKYGSITPSNVFYQAHFKQGTEVFWEKDGEYFCFG